MTITEQKAKPLSEEAKRIIREVLEKLNEIKDELPPLGKAAIGGLASILGYGKAPEKEDVLDILDSLTEPFVVKEVGAKLSNATRKVLQDVIKQLSTLLGEVYGKAPEESGEEEYRYPRKYYPRRYYPGYYYYAYLYPKIRRRKYPRKGYYPPYYYYYAEEPEGEKHEVSHEMTLEAPVEEAEGKEWEIVIIEAGLSKNKTFYPKEVLRDSAHLFEGVKVFADHPTKTEERELPQRSIKSVVGWIDNVRFEEDKLIGNLHLVADWLREMLVDAWEQGKKDLIGFSVNQIIAPPRIEKSAEGETIYNVQKILSVDSVDAVTKPAAGGRILKLLAGEGFEPAEVEEEDEPVAEVPVQEDENKEVEMEKVTELENKVDQMQRELWGYRVKEVVEATNLPGALKEKIKSEVINRVGDEEALHGAIKEQEKIFSEILSEKAVSRVQVTETSTERVIKGLTALFLNQPKFEDVPAFRSLKEAFAVYKGIPIFEVAPKMIIRESFPFDSELIAREAVTATNWAEVIGIAMTKALLMEYQLPYLDEWRQITSRIAALANTMTQERVRVPGYPKLTEVGWGETIQEITTADTEKATYDVKKFAKLESITDKVIYDDNLGAIQRIPRYLAVAAKTALYRAVFDKLANNETTSYDAKALFHADHNNLGSAALSYDEFSNAKAAMRQQKLFGTTEPLSYEPRFMIVPPQLEALAKTLQTSPVRPGAQYGHEVNIHANTFETIVVPTFTDANNWYLVADPRRTDTIEVGFLEGRQEPAIATEHPQAGSSFTADKLTYKVELIFGVCVLDHRAFWGAIVT